MKAVLLYLSLCSLVWAESELQPHYRKAKQKCVGEHQIMVKGRHSKHGFYIFNYMYSSSVPNNQTQIEKEDNKKNISNATDEFDSKSRKHLEKLTDGAQETRQGQKVEKGEKERLEDRTTTEGHQSLHKHHGSPRKWDFHQHHLKVIIDKGRNEIPTEDTTTDIDGSGDAGLTGQEDTHHGLIIGKGPHEQGKDQQITRGSENDKPGTKDKDGKSGISSSTKPSKHGYIKIGEKENDLSLSSVIQETNSDHYSPKKMKDPQSKDYSKVSLKDKTIPTNKESGRSEGGSSIDLLGKEGHLTATLNSHHSEQGNLSRNIPGKAEHGGESNHTSISGTGEIKTANEKDTQNATEHKKGKYEATVIVRKQNEEKDQSGVTKSHKKEDMRGDIISSHREVSDKVKLHKKDEAREDVLKEKTKSHMEAVVISKIPKKDNSDVGAAEHKKGEHEATVIVGKQNEEKDQSGVTKSHKKEKVRGDIISSHGEVTDKAKLHKKDEAREDVLKGKSKNQTEEVGISKSPRKAGSGLDVSRQFINELEDPVFTKPDKNPHSGVILDGFGITQSHPKSGMSFHGRVSGSQISGSDATQEGTKEVSRIGTTHRRSSTGKEDSDLAKPHRKEVGSHEKTNRTDHESSLGDRGTHEKGKSGFLVKLEEVSENIIKRNTTSNEAPGAAVDLKKSNIMYSPDRKAEHQGQKSIDFKSIPSFSHGSHNHVQHPFNSPKHGSHKSREHSSTSMKSVKNVIKPSKETAKANIGTYGSKIAKQHHGYSGTLRRKSSRRDKMHPPVKRGYKSDSSQSSESEESSWRDSRQSYKDYQNDEVDSYQSAESAQLSLSLESKESDGQSQMEDWKSSSREDDQEHKSSA